MPPKHLRPISMCRREINKHEEIAVRSAHALPRVLAARSCRRRFPSEIAEMRCRAFLPSEIPVGDRGDALPRVLAARGRPTDPHPPPPLPPRHPSRHSPPRHPSRQPPAIPPRTPPHHIPSPLPLTCGEYSVERIVWRGNTTPRSHERRLERARRRQPVNLVNPATGKPCESRRPSARDGGVHVAQRLTWCSGSRRRRRQGEGLGTDGASW
jgi:hypothetical protein